jgi:hypothetical protein
MIGAAPARGPQKRGAASTIADLPSPILAAFANQVGTPTAVYGRFINMFDKSMTAQRLLDVGRGFSAPLI